MASNPDMKSPFEILAQGQEAKNAYIEAIKYGRKCIFQTRLMVVGAERVGKTSLVKALTGQQFDPYEDVTNGISTLSVQLSTNWTLNSNEGKTLQQIVTAVSEIMGPGFNENAEALLKQKDKPQSTQEKSEETRKSAKEPQATADIPKEVVQMLVKRFHEKRVGTVDDLTLSIWDFAGQLVNITHQVFLSSRAVYIICFDLRNDLNKPARVEIYTQDGQMISEHYMTNLEFIIFSLRSIYSNTTENPTGFEHHQLSPPVFIVGTHRECLPGNAEQQWALAKEILASIEDKIKDTPYEGHVVTRYYAVENSKAPIDQEIIELRDHITKVARNEPYMKYKIPIKWLDVLFQIERLCREDKHFMNFKEVKDLAATCGVHKEDELFCMLHFFHDLGDIIYYGERGTPDSILNGIVILDLCWLIEIFNRVFNYAHSMFARKTLLHFLRKLEDEGLLHEELLRHMWHDSPKQFEALLQLLQMFGFLIERRNNSENDSRIFYAPSLVMKKYDEMPSESESVFKLYIDFKSFLPEGLFYQLLVRLLEWPQWKVGESKLSYQRADMHLNEDHDLIVRILPQDRSIVEVAIIRIYQAEDIWMEPFPEICKQVLKFLCDYLSCPANALMKRRIDYEFLIFCDKCKSMKNLERCLKMKKHFRCNIEPGTEPKRMNVEKIKRLFQGWKSKDVPLEIQGRGVDAIKAYQEAIKFGYEHIYQTRLMLVGQERVGKTSLIKALTGKEFNPTEEITDGIDASQLCTLNIRRNWTSKQSEGNEASQQLNTAAAKSAAKYMKQLKSRIQESHKQYPGSQRTEHSGRSEKSPETHTKLNDPGTSSQEIDSKPASEENSPERKKSDESKEDISIVKSRKNQQPDSSTIQKILKNEGFEESDDLTLSIWDFGGQDVYYNTHQVFLVTRAVYIICFNLSHDLNAPAEIEIQCAGGKPVTFVKHYMTNLEFIDFWCNSIYTHTDEVEPVQDQNRPVMFIVGTHMDKLTGDDQNKKERIHQIFKTIKEMVISKRYVNHIVLYHAVDNTRSLDESFVELKDRITEVAKSEKYMGEQVPIMWLNFMKEIEELRKEKPSINFIEVKSLAAECGIIDDIGLFTMLHFYHDIGNICYFGKRETPDSPLNNIVILESKWLIDIFRKVFTVKTKPYETYRDSVDKLNKQGILDEKLLKYMWRDYIDPEEPWKLVGLLELTLEFDLLCEKTPSEELWKFTLKGNRIFYVPSLLKMEGEMLLPIYTDCKINSVLTLYINFDGILPDSIFYRLIVRLLQWSQDRAHNLPNATQLSHQQAKLFVDCEHDVTLSIVPERRSLIQVAIKRFHRDPVHPVEPYSAVCIDVLTVLEKNMKHLLCTWMKRPIKFEFCILCGVCKTEKSLESCLKLDAVPCGKERMYTDRIQRLLGGWKSIEVRKRAKKMSLAKSPVVRKSQKKKSLAESPESSKPINQGSTKTKKQKKTKVTKKTLCRDFLMELSDKYNTGESRQWLRFLLHDSLTISQLPKDAPGILLFNELEKENSISYTDVNILLEIAEVTKIKTAEDLVRECMKSNKCNTKECRGLNTSRKALFGAMRELEDDDLKAIIGYYKLSPNDFHNIWDVVFQLQKMGCLDLSPVKMDKFVKLINPTAKKTLLDILRTISTDQPGPSTS